MLNMSRFTGYGHILNTMSEMPRWGGGGSYFWRGFAKGGIRPNPPGYEPVPFLPVTVS